MFLYEDKEIPIPEFLFDESNLKKNSCVNSSNPHIFLIIENTYEDLCEYLDEYIDGMNQESFNELIYLFKAFKLERYIRLLVKKITYRILYDDSFSLQV